jgi:hypothetical protein
MDVVNIRQCPDGCSTRNANSVRPTLHDIPAHQCVQAGEPFLATFTYIIFSYDLE